MSYTIEEMKADLVRLDDRQFYLKHIVRSDNWYFENVLGCPKEELARMSDDFRMIISDSLGVDFGNVMLVGSGKIGFSLSPTEKLFLPFSKDGTDREDEKASDLDVALISNELFHKYWMLFRQSYASKFNWWYKNYIYNGIYRGYINEKWINAVDGCRQEWETVSAASKNKLTNSLFIQNEVNYRIYRSWADFEEYNLKNIKEIKKRM